MNASERLDAYIAKLEQELCGGDRMSEPFRSEFIAKLLEAGWPKHGSLEVLEWAAKWSGPHA